MDVLECPHCGEPSRYDHDACDHADGDVMVCTHCGAPAMFDGPESLRVPNESEYELMDGDLGFQRFRFGILAAIVAEKARWN